MEQKSVTPEQNGVTLKGMYADAYNGILSMAEKKYITIGDDLKTALYFSMDKLMSLENMKHVIRRVS